METLLAWTTLAEEYLGALLVQSYNEENVANYRKYLHRFLKQASAEGRDLLEEDRRSPTAIDHAFLLRWMQGIRMSGVNERSLQANKTAVSGFYRWLIRVGKLNRNPIDMLAPIKLPEILPKPLPVNDTLKLLYEVEKLGSLYLERNRAILELFYASGLRESEVSNLDVNDLVLDSPDPYVIVRQGKGKRDGIAPLTRPAVDALKAYLQARTRHARRWEKPSSYSPLFLSRSGRRMSRWDLWLLVDKAGRVILGRHISPHQFRHSFCTHLLDNGADLMSIKELARHKNLATTQKYLSVSLERLKQQYAKHPRNRQAEGGA